MDNQRSKAASTFGKAFMDEANSVKPLPKNSMVESQKNAQSRPIPTYAQGGRVDMGEKRKNVDMGEKRKAVDLGEKRKNVDTGEKRVNVDMGEKRVKVAAPEYAQGGKVAKAVDAYRKADQAADAKIVAKVVAKKSGGRIDCLAAGGIGKKRHNVPDPGRGTKLGNTY